MKRVELKNANSSLAHYTRRLAGEALVVTRRNRPIAAVVPLAGIDDESLLLGTKVRFLELLDRSRRSMKNAQAVSTAELQRELDVDPAILLESSDAQRTAIRQAILGELSLRGGRALSGEVVEAVIGSLAGAAPVNGSAPSHHSAKLRRAITHERQKLLTWGLLEESGRGIWRLSETGQALARRIARMPS